MSICLWHLCTKEAKIKFCSSNCKSKYHVNNRRKALKQKAIDYLGGKCCRCNYDKCNDALEFHHTDPENKEFGLSAGGITRSWDKVKAELDKCILLCSNCHKEEHTS